MGYCTDEAIDSMERRALDNFATLTKEFNKFTKLYKYSRIKPICDQYDALARYLNRTGSAGSLEYDRVYTCFIWSMGIMDQIKNYMRGVVSNGKV